MQTRDAHAQTANGIWREGAQSIMIGKIKCVMPKLVSKHELHRNVILFRPYYGFYYRQVQKGQISDLSRVIDPSIILAVPHTTSAGIELQSHRAIDSETRISRRRADLVGLTFDR